MRKLTGVVFFGRDGEARADGQCMGLNARTILIGGGGHAAVMLDAMLSESRTPKRTASEAPVPLTGYLDDRETPLGERVEYLGPFERLDEVLQRPGELKWWALAVGDLGVRRRLLDGIKSYPGSSPLNLVHTQATVSDSVILHLTDGSELYSDEHFPQGDRIRWGRRPITRNGIFVGARAVVQARTEIRPHCIINTGAIVEHDCLIGENVHIAPGAVLGGSVKIGSDTLIGLGARVKPGVKIGSGVTVGVGAVVIHDIADGQIVVGVPARAIKDKASV